MTPDAEPGTFESIEADLEPEPARNPYTGDYVETPEGAEPEPKAEQPPEQPPRDSHEIKEPPEEPDPEEGTEEAVEGDAMPGPAMLSGGRTRRRMSPTASGK